MSENLESAVIDEEPASRPRQAAVTCIRDASHSPPEQRPLGLPGVMLSAICTAILAGVVVGLGEFILTVTLSAAPSHAGWWPADLVLAAAGRAAATYLIFSIPVMLICGFLYWLCIPGKLRNSPEIALLAIYMVIALLTAYPAWVEMAPNVNSAVLIPGLMLGAALAAFINARLRAWRRSLGDKRFRRAYYTTVGAALAAFLPLGGFFVQSPLFNPGTYKASRGLVAADPPTTPHVLWIVCDTLRADRLGVYGYDKPTTPFLDKWAKNSIVFDRAVANGMWTLPSHSSMFTGLSVREHGMGGPTTKLDDARVTIAELLAQHGYQTALFSNNPLVGPQTNLSQGFGTTRVPWEFLRELRCSLEYFCEQWGITPLVPWMDPGFGATLTNELVARWLDDRGDAPAFVFVNYMEAHLPYLSTKNYREMFLTPEQVRRSYDLRRRAYGEIADFLTFEANIEGYERVSRFDRETLKDMYDASIRCLDARVEELIDLFRKRGMLEDALVIITSDHGEHLETHGMWSHHFLLYDDLIHVPMIITPPGGSSPRRVKTPVQLSDLYLTVSRAALGSTPVNENPDARDLLALAEEPLFDRLVVSHTFGARPNYVDRLLKADSPRLRHLAFAQTAAIDPRFKLMSSLDGTRELYDTLADPAESVDLMAVDPQKTALLDDELAGWRRRTPEYTAGQTAPKALDPEVKNLLQTLGYIQAED